MQSKTIEKARDSTWKICKWTLSVSTLVLFIGCITASVTFQVTEPPFEGDNTTLTDARSILRCLQLFGFLNSTIVATDMGNELAVYNNRTTINTTELKGIAVRCHIFFGYVLTFHIIKWWLFPRGTRLRGYVVWSSGRVPHITQFGRNTVIYNDGMTANLLIRSTSETNVCPLWHVNVW